MVPITREYLRDFYKQYPDPTISQSTVNAREKLQSVASALSIKPENIKAIPNRMDEGMFRARCACEESIEALKSVKHANIAKICAVLQSVADRFELFQDKQRNHASNIVKSFLPQDFRGQIFQQASSRSETKNKQEINELIRRGGSIAEKFDLLWRQQWNRRETLGAVGNASGIWKIAVKVIAGVPEPLLDFAKQINVPNGPTEELRIKFAPVFYRLVEFSCEVAQFSKALQKNSAAGNTKDLDVAIGTLAVAANELLAETRRFCELLELVVESSPFFVSENQIKQISAKNDK